MTLAYIAAIIESVYNNGPAKDGSRKMDFDDFFQMSRAANGSVMRAMWFEENQAGNANLYFADSVTVERYEIIKKGRFRVAVLEEGGAVKLPYNMGILRVMPAMTDDVDSEEECEEFDGDDFFTKGEPGYEHTFGASEMLDDIGVGFYVPIANSLRLWGFEEAKYVEVDIIKNDESLDVPEGAAWTIINTVLGPVLKVAGFPVDVTDDNNPNVVTIKKQLADPQGL